jgi:hypothetical protein
LQLATAARRHPLSCRWKLLLALQASGATANWNGTLLLYSHGYSPVLSKMPPPTAPRGLHDQLLSEGYALAASAYSGAGKWRRRLAPAGMDAFEQRLETTRTIAWGN